MLLTRIFKFFRVNLDDETMRVPKAMSDEYNEKTLKRMGYELVNNQWNHKFSKKVKERSSSKGKEALGSEVPETEGFVVEINFLWLRYLNQ